MNFSFSIRFAILVFLSLFWASCTLENSATEKNKVCFKKSCIEVEVARTQDELSRGLQMRKSLTDHQGMLFIFPQSGINDFWMKDTLIPLDIIWLDENQTVIYIASNLPACLKDPCLTYGPSRECRYVLEINGGHTEKLHIQIGDKAEFHFK